MNISSDVNISFVQKELSKGEFKNLKRMFNGIPPYDIAILIESSSPNNRAIIWQLIDDNIEGEVLSNLSDEVRENNYLNTASALIKQSIFEMEIFVEHLKGKKETVKGLAGLGDLYVSSGGGRNAKMGAYICLLYTSPSPRDDT